MLTQFLKLYLNWVQFNLNEPFTDIWEEKEERKDMNKKDYKFLPFPTEWCEKKAFKIDVTLN